MILGLDASSAIVGFTVLDGAGSIKDAGIINIKKYNLLDKFDILCEELSKINLNIRHICIEDFAKKFMGGKSSVHTIILLAQSNILTQLAAKKVFGVAPSLINVSSARKIVVGKIPKDEHNKKEYTFQWFLKAHPTEINHLIRKKKNVELFNKLSYDIVDSYIVAYFLYKQVFGL